MRPRPPTRPQTPLPLTVVVAREGALERLPQVGGEGAGGRLWLAVVLAHHGLDRLSGALQVVVRDLQAGGAGTPAPKGSQPDNAAVLLLVR
jgi:hypothetical protein